MDKRSILWRDSTKIGKKSLIYKSYLRISTNHEEFTHCQIISF